MHDNGCVLLAANYSNNTGYAWKNIYKLYNSIARSLIENNYSVCLSFAELSLPIEFIDKDIPISVLVFNPLRITLRSLITLRKAILKQNIRYVYFTDMGTWHWLYILLRFWGVVKIIVHCRVSVSNPNPSIPERGIAKLFKSVLNRIPAIRADHLYVISDFVASRIVNKNCYPSSRVTKIYNGIDTKAYSCSDTKPKRNKVIIFCAARAAYYKGIATLIKATKILSKDYRLNNFHVQYAGDGPDLSRFKALSRQLNVSDTFEYLGHLKSTNKHVCDADIIVVPSEWGEGFASTVAEGMAAGKAVVATTAGGIPEVLGDSMHGQLIAPGDSKGLADTLYHLIRNEDLRIKLGNNAEKRAKKYFDENLYHQRVIDCLIKNLSSSQK